MHKGQGLNPNTAPCPAENIGDPAHPIILEWDTTVGPPAGADNDCHDWIQVVAFVTANPSGNGSTFRDEPD